MRIPTFLKQFQFQQVRLKPNRLFNPYNPLWVSIPTGTIKALFAASSSSFVISFQFQQVRLKRGIISILSNVVLCFNSNRYD